MTMSDHEITDLVRQMAAPPPAPTYGEAEVEELVRMHADGQQYKQLKFSRENNREQQQMLYAELKVLGWVLGRKERDVVMEINQ